MPFILGWTALAGAILIPLLVSFLAMLRLRDLHCSEQFSYTFAPLLVTCGTRSPLALVVGWTGTIVTLAGVIVAIIAALITVTSRRYAKQRGDARLLCIGVAVVLITTLAVLASNPDSVWGINSWIFFCAAGSALALALVLMVSRVTRRRAQNPHKTARETRAALQRRGRGS